MNTDVNEERARAFHEAGHCWGFWHTGHRLRYTSLRPRTPGFNAITVGRRKWNFDELDAVAVVALCGPLSELCHRYLADPDGDDDASLAAVNIGAQHDLPKMKYFLGGAPRTASLADLVISHWDGITQVAEELIRLRTLSGRQVFDILDATDPGGPKYPHFGNEA